jgi:hypothetical protein
VCTLIDDAVVEEGLILARERKLRAWFTRDAEPVLREIDGLDIGWAGVQRWATSWMPTLAQVLHLDIACGYATFLAQLGWRFPTARLVGLNIDFQGPHRLARPLLNAAEVSAALVQADARRMPFASGSFDSVSCFLGLQDVEIGSSDQGVRWTLTEAVRTLRWRGVLVLLDEFPFERFDLLLDGLPLRIAHRGERTLDVRWSGHVAERAIALYAQGYVAQSRVTDPAARRQEYDEVHSRMTAEMKRQLRDQGYYVPFGPVRMVVARKVTRLDSQDSHGSSEAVGRG